MGILGDCDLANFSNNFWGFSPLFVKDSLPDLKDFFHLDEVLGAASSDEVISAMLVTPREGDWTVSRGPFDGLDPSRGHWALTLRELERHFPDLEEVLNEFSFIPNWRRDDLILRYTTAGTVTGPSLNDRHRFFICVSGNARWEGAYASSRPSFVPGLPAEIVEGFEAQFSFEAKPGDLLYLPPRNSYRFHSEEEHLVLSLSGYAPTRSELLMSFMRACPDARLEMKPNAQEGALLSASSIEEVRQFMAGLLQEPEFERWLGSHLTVSAHRLVYPVEQPLSVRQFKPLLAEQEVAYRSHRVRWNYSEGVDPMLFVDGRSYPLATEVARTIVESQPIELSELHGHEDILCDLYNHGFIEFPDEEDEDYHGQSSEQPEPEATQTGGLLTADDMPNLLAP